MYNNEIQELENNHLLRAIRDRYGAQGAHIVLDAGILVNFASNDYLALAADQRITASARAVLDNYGFGAGASRLLSGGTTLHRRLEMLIAELKGTQDALLFPTGYAANIGALPALALAGDTVFSDELNHASIIDGLRLSRAKVHIYKHRDMAHLRTLLQNTPAEDRRIIVTDSVFSMDGDIAPLHEIDALCREYSALLYIDDAHGTGVLGNGSGALAHFNINMPPAEHIIQMGTLSKAVGSLGGFIASTHEVITYLRSTARGFMFTTALPAAVCAASLEALNIIHSDRTLNDRLWDNTNYLREELHSAGLRTGNSETPIIPIRCGGAEAALAISERLLRMGMYVPAIRPPTVREARLRITVTAGHRKEDMDRLVEGLSEVST